MLEVSGYNADNSAVVARTFDRVASQYDAHAEVCRQIGQRLLDRLELLTLQPETVLDIGCGTGLMLGGLRARFKKCRLIGVDISAGMLATAENRSGWWRKPSLLVADAHHLPIPSCSVDLIVSNLMLPWCHDPHQVFSEMYRVLSPGGAVLFSTCGPDTLIEYRSLWQSIDSAVHGFGLVDMHDFGDSMHRLGFAAPVLDRENITIDYPSIAALENELQLTGAVNIALGRRRGLMGSHLLSALHQQQLTDSRFAVSVELVQGHGWKGEHDAGEHRADGEYVVSLDQFRNRIRRQ